MCNCSSLKVSLMLLTFHVLLHGRESRADNSSGDLTYRANGVMPKLRVSLLSSPGTLPPELEIEVVEITTSSITVHWFSNDEEFSGNVTSWTVQYDNGRQVTVSPDLPVDRTEFVINNLQVESSYYICVAVHLLSDYGVGHGGLERGRYSSSSETFTKSVCEAISTIPYIRSDSVLALILTIGVIGFMVVIGVVQWWRAKSRFVNATKSRAESRDRDGSIEMLNVGKPCERAKPVCSIEQRT